MRSLHDYSPCIECREPENWTDEKIAASRGETLDEWLAFKAMFDPVPEYLKPGTLVTLDSDIYRPRRRYVIVCAHGSDIGVVDTTNPDATRATLIGWTAVRDVIGVPSLRQVDGQLDLFGGAV